MKECLLTTDEFSQPMVLEDQNAVGTLLLRLFLLQPGTNPLHPEMGIGLVPKYRFITTADLNDLTTLIKDQIQTYLPLEYSSTAEVYLEIKPTKYLLITIIINDVKYIFDTEKSKTPVQLSEIIN
jgi:hypothetical protein